MAREKLYKNLTLNERMILFLKDYFKCEDYPSKNKYDMLKFEKDGKVKYYFIGKNGAVRVNQRPSATDTISVTDKYKLMLEKYEQMKGLV